MYSKRHPILDETLPLRQHTVPSNNATVQQRVRGIENQLIPQRNPIYRSGQVNLHVMSPEQAKATMAAYMPMPKRKPVLKAELPKLNVMSAARAKATVEDYMLRDRRKRNQATTMTAEVCGKGYLVKTEDNHHYYVESVD